MKLLESNHLEGKQILTSCTLWEKFSSSREKMLTCGFLEYSNNVIVGSRSVWFVVVPHHVYCLGEDLFQILFPILILCSGIRTINKRFWLLHCNYENKHMNSRAVLILSYISPAWRGNHTISRMLCLVTASQRTVMS